MNNNLQRLVDEDLQPKCNFYVVATEANGFVAMGYKPGAVVYRYKGPPKTKGEARLKKLGKRLRFAHMDAYADHPQAGEPGSKERVDFYASRVAAGLPLFE